MSNLDPRPDETDCSGSGADRPGPVSRLLTGRDVVLGGPRGLKVTRTLPNRDVRTIGAWCFVDHYGPAELGTDAGMSVPPHPHTGLQTVSWLLRGEVRHRDSVGHDQLVVPGQLNLMTAGQGISHAEHSPPPGRRSPVIHGAQLWVALPQESRNQAPHFEHHPDLPVVDADGARIVVIMGELAGATSPAATYSPLVGAEISLVPGAEVNLRLRPDFEYAVLPLAGETAVEGESVAPGPLLYLGAGRDWLELACASFDGSKVLLLGGEPFAEQLVMWWNFVGRDHDEIVASREQWQAGDRRFGTVTGEVADLGGRLDAPRLPNARLAPRPGRRT